MKAVYLFLTNSCKLSTVRHLRKSEYRQMMNIKVLTKKTRKQIIFLFRILISQTLLLVNYLETIHQNVRNRFFTSKNNRRPQECTTNILKTVQTFHRLFDSWDLQTNRLYFGLLILIYECEQTLV